MVALKGKGPWKTSLSIHGQSVTHYVIDSERVVIESRSGGMTDEMQDYRERMNGIVEESNKKLTEKV